MEYFQVVVTDNVTGFISGGLFDNAASAVLSFSKYYGNRTVMDVIFRAVGSNVVTTLGDNLTHAMVMFDEHGGQHLEFHARTTGDHMKQLAKDTHKYIGCSKHWTRVQIIDIRDQLMIFDYNAEEDKVLIDRKSRFDYAE
ncbi:MAG: hypothetical protein NC218_01505 [Acetobacter sp.]|nr:hypothetical protein [Acetobacter sp.]